MFLEVQEIPKRLNMDPCDHILALGEVSQIVTAAKARWRQWQTSAYSQKQMRIEQDLLRDRVVLVVLGTPARHVGPLTRANTSVGRATNCYRQCTMNNRLEPMERTRRHKCRDPPYAEVQLARSSTFVGESTSVAMRGDKAAKQICSSEVTSISRI